MHRDIYGSEVCWLEKVVLCLELSKEQQSHTAKERRCNSHIDGAYQHAVP